jgi:hypothetical protein
VIIRAGSPVIVRVAARDRRYVALDFDAQSSGKRDRVAKDGQASVRFYACPPDTNASLTASRSASGPATRED